MDSEVKTRGTADRTTYQRGQQAQRLVSDLQSCFSLQCHLHPEVRNLKMERSEGGRGGESEQEEQGKGLERGREVRCIEGKRVMDIQEKNKQ